MIPVRDGLPIEDASVLGRETTDGLGPLMEQLSYNLVFLWFVSVNADHAVWVPAEFTKTRDCCSRATSRRHF